MSGGRKRGNGTDANGGGIPLSQAEATFPNLDDQGALGAQHPDALPGNDAEFAQTGSESGRAGNFGDDPFDARPPFGEIVGGLWGSVCAVFTSTASTTSPGKAHYCPFPVWGWRDSPISTPDYIGK